MSMARCLNRAFRVALWAVSGTSLCLMTACSSSQSAAFTALRNVARPNAAVDSSPLNPKLTYLRVTVNNKALLMVLGYVDRSSSEWPEQVWYSESGEVLRLRAGRLAGLVGTPVEWRSVRWPAGLPAWGADRVSPAPYKRLLDEMPGYRLGVEDTLRLQSIAPPSSTAWRGSASAGVRWYQEVSSSGSVSARYAVRQTASGAVPVYGEQCLAADFCLTWQSWPPLPKTTP